MSHGRSNILQGRTDVHSANLEGSIEVGGGHFVFLVLLDGRKGDGRFLGVLGVELTDAIAHNVDYFFVFGGLLVILFHYSAEAVGKLDEEFGTAALLLGHFHELRHMYWGAEEFGLIALFELRTDLVFAAEELLPFLHKGRHFLAVHGQNNLYESR